MQTNQNIITVTSKPPGTQDGIESDPKKRPCWMVNGSFLAFRKLEQDVQRWIDLINRFADADCKNPDHCGAKLMGRWKSGKYPKTSPKSSFFFGDNRLTYNSSDRSSRRQIPRGRRPSWFRQQFPVQRRRQIRLPPRCPHPQSKPAHRRRRRENGPHDPQRDSLRDRIRTIEPARPQRHARAPLRVLPVKPGEQFPVRAAGVVERRVVPDFENGVRCIDWAGEE